MLFCCKVGFVAIYAVLLWNLFCGNSRTFVLKKIEPTIPNVEKNYKQGIPPPHIYWAMLHQEIWKHRSEEILAGQNLYFSTFWEHTNKSWHCSRDQRPSCWGPWPAGWRASCPRRCGSWYRGRRRWWRSAVALSGDLQQMIFFMATDGAAISQCFIKYWLKTI